MPIHIVKLTGYILKDTVIYTQHKETEEHHNDRKTTGASQKPIT